MKINKAAVMACLFLSMIIIAGCSSRVEKYGKEVTASDSTPIEQILAKPADFAGKPIVVEGRIIRECPSGCWFDIDAGGAPLYVDISGAGLAIPQHVGKTVRVTGTVSVKDTQVKFAGEGVEIK